MKEAVYILYGNLNSEKWAQVLPNCQFKDSGANEFLTNHPNLDSGWFTLPISGDPAIPGCTESPRSLWLLGMSSFKKLTSEQLQAFVDVVWGVLELTNLSFTSAMDNVDGLSLKNAISQAALANSKDFEYRKIPDIEQRLLTVFTLIRPEEVRYTQGLRIYIAFRDLDFGNLFVTLSDAVEVGVGYCKINGSTWPASIRPARYRVEQTADCLGKQLFHMPPPPPSLKPPPPPKSEKPKIGIRRRPPKAPKKQERRLIPYDKLPIMVPKNWKRIEFGSVTVVLVENGLLKGLARQYTQVLGKIFSARQDWFSSKS